VIASLVGFYTQTWLGFFATLLGLGVFFYSPAGFLLSLGLSVAWGFIGYSAGDLTGEPFVPWIAAVLFFSASASLHGVGFGRLATAKEPTRLREDHDRLRRRRQADAHPAGLARRDRGPVIDAQWREV
jgi:hypothetical protein